jgi:hypothetical protein
VGRPIEVVVLNCCVTATNDNLAEGGRPIYTVSRKSKLRTEIPVHVVMLKTRLHTGWIDIWKSQIKGDIAQ